MPSSTLPLTNWKRLRAACLLALTAGIASGCSGALDRLLSADSPSRVPAETLDEPRNASLAVSSAVTDFECALANYVVATGALGNEIADDNLSAQLWGYDRRDVPAGGGISGVYSTSTCTSGNVGLYTPLSTARYQADHVLENLEGWTDADVPNRASLIARAAAYAGYAYVLAGEGLCSAAFDVGPELAPPQILALAEQRFTRAIAAAQASGNTEMLNMARVGRARTLLNLGKAAEALADAQLVPAGFAVNATYSDNSVRRYNRVYAAINRDATFTIQEDFRDVRTAGSPDPRVPVSFAGRNGSDQVTPLWVQNKYTSLSAPIPIARSAEAQLIVAEVTGGQTAVNIINALRARAGLPAFSSSDETEIRKQVIAERQRELFLESQHLADLRRYSLPFLPATGTPYPPKAGGFYGSLTCLPLPDVERLNNPNITK